MIYPAKFDGQARTECEAQTTSVSLGSCARWRNRRRRRQERTDIQRYSHGVDLQPHVGLSSVPWSELRKRCDFVLLHASAQETRGGTLQPFVTAARDHGLVLGLVVTTQARRDSSLQLEDYLACAEAVALGPGDLLPVVELPRLGEGDPSYYERLRADIPSRFLSTTLARRDGEDCWDYAEAVTLGPDDLLPDVELLRLEERDPAKYELIRTDFHARFLSTALARRYGGCILRMSRLEYQRLGQPFWASRHALWLVDEGKTGPGTLPHHSAPALPRESDWVMASGPSAPRKPAPMEWLGLSSEECLICAKTLPKITQVRRPLPLRFGPFL